MSLGRSPWGSSMGLHMSLRQKLSEALGAPEPQGEACEWCGEPATHFCTGCGKWVCDALACGLKSTIAAGKKRILGEN